MYPSRPGFAWLDFTPLIAYSSFVPALLAHRAEVLIERPLRTGDCNPARCLKALPKGGAFAFLTKLPNTTVQRTVRKRPADQLR
jgi:hypothetical protein